MGFAILIMLFLILIAIDPGFAGALVGAIIQITVILAVILGAGLLVLLL